MESKPLIRSRSQVYSFQSLTRKAAVDLTTNDSGLKKCLTAVDLIAYGVGSTVGAGIFVTVGVVANEHAGPAVLISFLTAAFACLISAFCYAEFAARIPMSGSAYTFAYVALGEVVGWFIGWNLTLEYSISASAVARGWASYTQQFLQLLGVYLPDWLVGFTPEFLPESIAKWISISPLSVVIIFICTCILIMGVKDSATFNLTITIINVVTILFVILFGAKYVDTSNWTPFFPYQVSGAFAGAGLVFFSYIGFDSVTTLAGEVSRPSRDLPLGIVGTLGIATSLYVGVSLVLTGMVNYTNINTDSPLSDAFDQVGVKWAAIVISVGGVTALVAGTLCSLLGQPRIYYQMAKDGLLPPHFAQVHPRTQAPVFGTVVTGLSASVLALLLDLDALATMISIGTLLAFTVVCGGIIVLRCNAPDGHAAPLPVWNSLPVPALVFLHFLDSVLVSFGYKDSWAWWEIFIAAIPMFIIAMLLSLREQPNKPSTFQCPLVPIVPLVGVLVNTFLIVQLNIDSIYRVLGWTGIGMAIYFGYGIRHSKLNYTTGSGSVNDYNFAKIVDD